MHVDVLVAEIGSTTTVVNAFNLSGSTDRQASGLAGHSEPVFLGQGQTSTTVIDGDVTIGLRAAIADLKHNLGYDQLIWDEMLATSSAAGGLRMSVHGLVYDMTVRAAKEAALGAGAIVRLVTAGKMRNGDVNNVRDLNPNIILIAGGVDFGERETAVDNFKLIASLHLDVPVIYAGNIENHKEIAAIASEHGIALSIVENVYPKVDELNVEPARRVIQHVFEEHITHAPGMTLVRQMVNGAIIPTPGAVMEAAKLLREDIGNLLVFDVGGATTDVHSVTKDSNEYGGILISPEPLAKRTVEGDLGVFVNLRHIVEMIGLELLKEEFPDAEQLIECARPIPVTEREIAFIERLTRHAVLTSLERHAGRLRHLYGHSGKKTLAEGKDLTDVKFIIGTGGALTRLPAGQIILSMVGPHGTGEELFPKNGTRVLIDSNYIMASLGVLSFKHPDAALQLLRKSLGIN